MSKFRRQLMMANVGEVPTPPEPPTPVLPYDAQVEWLQSDGNQYIDTGIKLNGTVRIVTDAQMLQVNTSAALFGTFLSAGRYGVRFNSGSHKLYLYYGGSGTYDDQRCTNYQGDSFYLQRKTYDFANVVTIGGETQTRAAGTSVVTFSSDENIYSFAINANALSAGTFAPCKAKKWSEKIYVNDVLVRDYIPVRKNGVGYFYDKVSGDLFGNSGTSVFTYGNDVTTT